MRPGRPRAQEAQYIVPNERLSQLKRHLCHFATVSKPHSYPRTKKPEPRRSDAGGLLLSVDTPLSSRAFPVLVGAWDVGWLLWLSLSHVHRPLALISFFGVRHSHLLSVSS